MQEEKESWSSVASEHACRSRQFCVHCVHQTRLCRCSVSLLAASASPTGHRTGAQLCSGFTASLVQVLERLAHSLEH